MLEYAGFGLKKRGGRSILSVQTSGALNGRTRGEARIESAKIRSGRKEMSNSSTAPEMYIPGPCSSAAAARILERWKAA